MQYPAAQYNAQNADFGFWAVFRIRDILYGSESGSADPHLWQTDPEPDLIVGDLLDDNIKICIQFFCLYLFEGKFTSFLKDKKS
jgi:hypothetical protein